MNRKRILFVDDEANVLEGLRNLLHKQRRTWDMVFSPGGEAALAELERAPFDVIVSDMRMPGMDGAALLQKVKDDYPSVARIVLSGHAEREAVLRAIPVAHQFLSKPCDGETLRVVIERTCNLQALLEDEAIRNVVGRLDKLPSAPRSYSELTRAMARPDVGLLHIAAIVEQDPAMSTKVLQLVNSAYFGLAQHISSIQQAIMYLGVEILKGLALTAHVFATMEAAPLKGFSLDELQQHSLLAARLARRLVSDPRCADEAFTAGIVHDIGKIVFALGLPDRFAGVLRTAYDSHRPFYEVERDAFGVTHAEVGSYLLGVWGLPFSIVEAVAYHHHPGSVTTGAREVLAAVHVADALLDTALIGESDPMAEGRLDGGFLDSVGLPIDLPHWQTLVAEETRVIAVAR